MHAIGAHRQMGWGAGHGHCNQKQPRARLLQCHQKLLHFFRLARVLALHFHLLNGTRDLRRHPQGVALALWAVGLWQVEGPPAVLPTTSDQAAPVVALRGQASMAASLWDVGA